MDKKEQPETIAETIKALPTINALFHTESGSNPRVMLPGFTQALIAYAKAWHVLIMLSNDAKRGLDHDDTEKLADAAAKLIDLANQKDAPTGQRMDVTIKEKYIPRLLLSIIELSPHRDRTRDSQLPLGRRP